MLIAANGPRSRGFDFIIKKKKIKNTSALPPTRPSPWLGSSCDLLRLFIIYYSLTTKYTNMTIAWARDFSSEELQESKNIFNQHRYSVLCSIGNKCIQTHLLKYCHDVIRYHVINSLEKKKTYSFKYGLIGHIVTKLQTKVEYLMI